MTAMVRLLMDDMSQMFAWGVLLAFGGLIALVVLTVVIILMRLLSAMSTRLVPVAAVVEEPQGPLTEAAKWMAPQLDLRPRQYRYEVGGKTYVGTLATLQPGQDERRAAERALSAHNIGDTITVFYDRDHPNRSVMDGRAPTVPAWVRRALVASVVVAFVGVVILFVSG
jgi:hypothetical protein